MNELSNAAAIMGKKGGMSGIGESKSKSIGKARMALNAKWKDPNFYIPHFWKRVDKKGEDECWEWMGCRTSGGYGMLTFRGKYKAAHRLAYEFYHGHISDKLDCCHTCDNPACCNPKHLFLGSELENIRDCISKGRFRKAQKGSKHHNSKLDEEKVSEIIKLSNSGTPMADIARKFSVTHGCVWFIVKGVSWKHVPR